jgi:hypothetical protein
MPCPAAAALMVPQVHPTTMAVAPIAMNLVNLWKNMD